MAQVLRKKIREVLLQAPFDCSENHASDFEQDFSRARASCCSETRRDSAAFGAALAARQGSKPGRRLRRAPRERFGDTLLLLLGHWAPPDGAREFVEVRLEGLAAPGPVTVLPGLGDGQDARLGVAYLTAEGGLRREALFAWSLGMQAAVAGMRCCCGRSAAFPEMRVAAVVLPYIKSRDALLITRRAARGGSYNSMWVFPGGAVDAGEAAPDAACRELLEETGVKLRRESLEFLCAYQARNEALCLTYLMLIYSGEAEEPCPLRLSRKEVAQAAYLTSAAADLLLRGAPAAEPGSPEGRALVDGVAHGALEEELVSRPVALHELRLALDGATATGPGIGAGHWFALREWRRRRRPPALTPATAVSW
ncbi:unnamed protein product [Prorocentrum cordatum]|uniref:Nudix hydrolase domain-containing protein n=1 Tax=Prorocentrum cordatum TaxID=2364126 RepID=A0ABN9W3K5_9DINO|nr:unnamed protein product [Polarella glacialis]